MSYFAQVINGLVTEVISADQEFIDAFENPSQWLQTSYNTRGNVHYGPDGKPDGGIAFRGNYAGIGYTYDTVNDVFYAQQPYASWILNNQTWLWDAPIPSPTDGKPYSWNESAVTWDLIK
jgi:hypothetical protein